MKTMQSESDAFLNQKPNKQTSHEKQKTLIAAVFHYVHPVEKKKQLKTSQVDTKLCQLLLSK